MPDNGQFPEDGFERRLEDLGDHVEYPPTPDLTATVRERIEGENRQRSGVGGWVAAAVVVLLILPVLVGLVMSGGGGMAGSAGSGGAVGGSGQGGGSGSTGGDAASGAPEDTEMLEETASGGESAVYGIVLDFGRLVSLEEARNHEERLLLPTASGLERPDEIFVGRSIRKGDFVLVYDARNDLPPLGGMDIGLILTETDGGAKPFLEDGPPTDLERVEVNGERAYWSPDGVGTTPQFGTAERLPGNVLIWIQDGRALRLQANIEKEEALRIAESIR